MKERNTIGIMIPGPHISTGKSLPMLKTVMFLFLLIEKKGRKKRKKRNGDQMERLFLPTGSTKRPGAVI